MRSDPLRPVRALGRIILIFIYEKLPPPPRPPSIVIEIITVLHCTALSHWKQTRGRKKKND